MSHESLGEKLSSGFSQSASAKNIFGDPIHADKKIIIPVASIAYAFGGGFGSGVKKGKPAMDSTEGLQGGEPVSGEGAGGGIRATAKGVFEITAARSRFIPVFSFRHLAAGVLIGYLLKTLLTSKRGRL